MFCCKLKVTDVCQLPCCKGKWAWKTTVKGLCAVKQILQEWCGMFTTFYIFYRPSKSLEYSDMICKRLKPTLGWFYVSWEPGQSESSCFICSGKIYVPYFLLKQINTWRYPAGPITAVYLVRGRLDTMTLHRSSVLIHLCAFVWWCQAFVFMVTKKNKNHCLDSSCFVSCSTLVFWGRRDDFCQV